ncbi:MAG TPA: FliI/YscN family ATPase [Rhodocyclaceae bacterium]|nr:FliI/YscN family ATPase [Rhodocyclaceae bacterium]
MTSAAIVERIRAAEFVQRLGRITNIEGLVVKACGPDAFLGELCTIRTAAQPDPIPAEVIAIRNGQTVLMPVGGARGFRCGDQVRATGRHLEVPVGDWLNGRVLDGIGRPIDGDVIPAKTQWRPLHPKICSPLSRAPVDTIVETGIRVIDTFLPIGRGQRMGIFAGSGVGKSTLLSMMAKNIKADVVVLALVGERGREVQDFVSQFLHKNSQRPVVVVAATSDQPALLRVHAAHTALAICDYFCEQGKHVAFIMDSITRFAMAQREIGISAGEPPSARGYTPSVFDALPKLVERCGNFKDRGSITALMTVLVEGDDLNDPVADTVRSLLDGAIVLSRPLSNSGHYPSVDVLASNSRLFDRLTEPAVKKMIAVALSAMGTYESHKEVIELGVYKTGANAEIERAIAFHKVLSRFLKQDVSESTSREQAVRELSLIVSAVSNEKEKI